MTYYLYRLRDKCLDLLPEVGLVILVFVALMLLAANSTDWFLFVLSKVIGTGIILILCWIYRT